MFPILRRQELRDYHCIELLVHCDMTSYRKNKHAPDAFWEVQGSDGQWKREYILDNIVEELYHRPEPLPEALQGSNSTPGLG